MRIRKHNKSHYWKIVGLAMMLPILFAILDIIGAAMWKSLGGFAGEAYIRAEPLYMVLFWTFAYALIIAIAFTYYTVTKDKSESLALLLIPTILLQFGAEDVFYYFIGGHEFWTATMPWLTENLWAPTLMAWTVGLELITGPVLLVSAIIGYFVAYFVAQKLVKITP